MPEPAPTRRSSRPSAASDPTPLEDPGVSRSERRRRSEDAAPARPAVVWGRTDQTSSSAATATATPRSLDPDGTPAADGRRSRRAARAAGQPLSEVVAEQTTAFDIAPAPVDPAAVPSTAATTPIAIVAPTGTPAIAESAPSAPTKRVRTKPVLLTPVEATATSPAETVVAESVDAEPVDAEPDTTVEPAASEPFELLEPVDVPDAADAEPAASLAPDDPAAPEVDEFAAAARLFSFTGENPILRPVAQDGDAAAPVAAHVAPRARRASRVVAFKRVMATSFSVGVMGIVGLLAVGMTTPAEAVAAATGTESAASYHAPAGDVAGAGQIQAYVAPSQIQNTTVDRPSTYETARLVDLAGVAGITNFSNSVFTNNPACPIQWPFAVGVTMSYGFGMRDGVMHEGIDFTPGNGAHIQAVADGVVRLSTDSGGGYGVTIVIDHIIDGQLVSSRYAHMQYGSRQVQAGDVVKVGQFIGKTGDTGFSFGAHTHFEILAGGTTAIDPMPWLRAHTTC